MPHIWLHIKQIQKFSLYKSCYTNKNKFCGERQFYVCLCIYILKCYNIFFNLSFHISPSVNNNLKSILKVGLEINPLQLSDAGVYGVKLENPLGEDSSEGKLNVRKVFQPPRFTQKFTDLQQVRIYSTYSYMFILINASNSALRQYTLYLQKVIHFGVKYSITIFKTQ